MEVKTLTKKIRTLPKTPGVYLFQDNRGKPLYIGKASNLRSRVSAYAKTADSRLVIMVGKAAKLDYQVTGSDIEALILESQLIKKYKPAFNIVMRDDKQYSFVGFTKDKFSKIFTTHQPTKVNFIGPFTDASALRTTLKYLRRIFPYCTCKQKHNVRCLNAHIDKCLGYCCLKNPETADTNQYAKNVRAIKDILSGKRALVTKRLEKELGSSILIQRLNRIFENARFIHSQKSNTVGLEQLRRVLNLPKTLERIEGYDISNIQGSHPTGSMVVFANGAPDKNEYRKFNIKTIIGSNDVAMLGEILTRRFARSDWSKPDLIIVDGGQAQFNIAASIQKKIPIIALTKNEYHVGDHIITQTKNIKLKDLPTPAKNLVLAVDAEAHRFAIAHYRHRHRQLYKQY